MIRFDDATKIFRLDAKTTTYAMQVVYDKYVVHLYYGDKKEDFPVDYGEKIVSFAPFPADVGVKFSLDTVATELSFFDSGDKRDTGIKIRNADGDAVTSFIYQGYRIFSGRKALDGMPHSRGGDETLEITYRDDASSCVLRSYYTVFEDSDCLVRYVEIENKGKSAVVIESLLACQLDLLGGEYERVYLAGEYGNERNVVTAPVFVGKQSIYSERGHSSHQFNPFLALKKSDATEDKGDVYAFEFVYSGDFEMQVEKTFDGRIRTMTGLNRNAFSWLLDAGENFVSPETILTFSSKGMDGLSQNLHSHIKNHIIPPKFVRAERPIVINTWEAVYFNINEDLLYDFALAAKDLGIDTLVVDDGWFGGRNDAMSSLGDWYTNREKFKQGLGEFSKKIHALGLKFGIWIEPEMISPNSDLYRAHPEWALRSKGCTPSLGRNQLVLDLCNDEAVRFIANTLIETLKEAKPDYIKWDFNRTLSESGSLALPKERQREVKHRFVLGSYKLHQILTEAFPDTLFEGCSGGGGRFDAGILYYCPQIWTSDTTDPVARLPIQKGTMLAYPPSTISCHVSNSRWNELEESLDYTFRGDVAYLGDFGYELNLLNLDEAQKAIIKDQIVRYKSLQGLVLDGKVKTIGRLNKDESAYLLISQDESRFALFYYNVGKEKNWTKTICADLQGEYEDEMSGERIFPKNGINIPKSRSRVRIYNKI